MYNFCVHFPNQIGLRLSIISLKIHTRYLSQNFFPCQVKLHLKGDNKFLSKGPVMYNSVYTVTSLLCHKEFLQIFYLKEIFSKC